MKTIILVALFLMCMNCTVTGQLSGPKNKVTTHSLDANEYTELRTFLETTSGAPLKDTIVLKYDFNNDDCWRLLDNQSEAYIRKVLEAQQQRINSKKNLSTRSILLYREKGRNFSKLKKWNTDIIIDESKMLIKLLFMKRDICGSSAIILPDRNVIIVRSDSHFEALDYSGSRIANLVNE